MIIYVTAKELLIKARIYFKMNLLEAFVIHVYSRT